MPIRAAELIAQILELGLTPPAQSGELIGKVHPGAKIIGGLELQSAHEKA
jgi:hypothetical protein